MCRRAMPLSMVVVHAAILVSMLSPVILRPIIPILRLAKSRTYALVLHIIGPACSPCNENNSPHAVGFEERLGK
jgi:hypothetical protein